MNENLIAVHATVDLTRDEIVQLGKNAFTITWLAEQDRNRYLGLLENYVAQSRMDEQPGSG
jgi:adenosine deaminase